MGHSRSLITKYRRTLFVSSACPAAVNSFFKTLAMSKPLLRRHHRSKSIAEAFFFVNNIARRRPVHRRSRIPCVAHPASSKSSVCCVVHRRSRPCALHRRSDPISSALHPAASSKSKYGRPDTGLSLSYLGVLFVFKPTVLTPGNINEAGEIFNTVSVTGGQTFYAVLIGLFSSFLNGICYCLIRAAAKASDHPVYTVFSFGLLVTPLSAICALALQKFVLPNIFTFFLMVVLGVLAFLAEISLARGLQLEKISKATNMIYIQVILSLAWSVSYQGASPSFNKLIGCLLILGSVCCTLYFGPEREPNNAS